MSTIKPMIILPPGNMDAENIGLLRQNGICVVVSEKPQEVKFVDAMAAVSSRTQIEQAAIKLSRYLVTVKSSDGTDGWSMTKKDITAHFVRLLIEGTPLDPQGTIEEREKKIYDATHEDEVRRIAREDARAERAARKEAKK